MLNFFYRIFWKKQPVFLKNGFLHEESGFFGHVNNFFIQKKHENLFKKHIFVLVAIKFY